MGEPTRRRLPSAEMAALKANHAEAGRDGIDTLAAGSQTKEPAVSLGSR